MTGLKEKLNKIETRVYQHDERLGEHQTLIDTTSFNLKLAQTTLIEHEEKLADGKRSLVVASGGTEGTS